MVSFLDARRISDAFNLLPQVVKPSDTCTPLEPCVFNVKLCESRILMYLLNHVHFVH